MPRPTDVDPIGDPNRTRLLFKEINAVGGIYSIKEWERMYVEAEDLTGYAGLTAIGKKYDRAPNTWSEWAGWHTRWPNFQRDYLDVWNEEIEVRLRSKALGSIVGSINTSDRNAVAAAKWIAEGKYDLEDKRTSKAKEKEKRIKAKVVKDPELHEFLDRHKQDLPERKPH